MIDKMLAVPPYVLADLDQAVAEEPADVLGRLAAMGCGPVTYLADPGNRGGYAVLTNHTTGRQWRRGVSGRWRPIGEPPAPPVQRVAERIAGMRVAEDVAEVLRQAVMPWLPVLRDARHYAVEVLGVPSSAALHAVELVTAAMLASNPRPHRLVMVVEEPIVLGAAFDADADLEPGHTLRCTLRFAAGQVRRHGAGHWPVPGGYPARSAALGDLVAALGARRPGQRFLLEPVPADDVVL
jgi:hypothetical protein